MPIQVEGAAGTTFTTVGLACFPVLGANAQLTGGSSTGGPFLLCILYIQVLEKLPWRFEAQTLTLVSYWLSLGQSLLLLVTEQFRVSGNST